jgi:hypothetical protein
VVDDHPPVPIGMFVHDFLAVVHNFFISRNFFIFRNSYLLQHTPAIRSTFSREEIAIVIHNHIAKPFKQRTL